MKEWSVIRRILYYLLSTVFCLLFIGGCSLPRILVLDDPLSPEEHLNLGVAYERSGEYESALKEYGAASKKLPVAHLYMGNVYFLKNDFESAESYYRKAIKKDPNNADAHNNLAWLLYVKGERLAEAEALAIKAIDLNPAKSDTYRDTLQKIRDAIQSAGSQ